MSVELRDGRSVEGYVALWDLGDSDQRSIVLQPPISVFTPVDGRQQGERKLVDRVILEGETVAAIWVIYDFEIDDRTRSQRLDIESSGGLNGN